MSVLHHTGATRVITLLVCGNSIGRLWADHFGLLGDGVICVAGSFVDAYSLMWAYRVRRMSTAHGSARWAKASDLIRCGLMNPIKGLPLPAKCVGKSLSWPRCFSSR